MGLNRVLALMACAVLSFTAFAKGNSVKPQWQEGDLSCPTASATDRYIEVPVYHDLATVAQVDRIPGLNLFKEKQENFAGKKMRIYYELFNGWDANKKLLILIPGGPGQTHADFHRLVDVYGAQSDLLKNFNVIAMDHRGVGCSRPLFPGNEPEDSMLMRQAASDIDLIRKELVGANGKINVWGYSYGSLLAQTYALLYPDQIERLFIGGTVSNIDDWHMAAVQYESLVFSAVEPKARDSFYELTANDKTLREAFLDWAFEPMYQYAGRAQKIPEKLNFVLEKLKAGEKQNVLQELASKPSVTPWMQRSIACIELFPYETKFPGEYNFWVKAIGFCSEYKGMHDYFHYTPLLKQINVPTLIYGGAFDHVTPPKAMLQMSQEIKNSFIFIDNYLGHGFGGKVGCIVRLTAQFFSGASSSELQQVAYSPFCQDAPRPQVF